MTAEEKTAAAKAAAEKAAADKAAKATDGKTTHVKIKRSHPDYGYHPGETGELPTEKANALIKGGFAEAVTPQTDETR